MINFILFYPISNYYQFFFIHFNYIIIVKDLFFIIHYKKYIILLLKFFILFLSIFVIF